MDAGIGSEEESVDLPVTLTQASSLYIMALNAGELFKLKIKELQARLKKATDEDEIKDLEEGISVISAVFEHTRFFEDEAKNIINELEPTHKPKGITLIKSV